MKKLLNISLLSSGAACTLLAALLAAAPAQARQLSVEEALQAAMADASSAKHAPGAKAYQLAYTAKSSDLNTVYVFNRGENGGFMLVAADDVVEQPVLGYCSNGNFDPAKMPENLAGWLEDYSNQIAYAAANGGRVISAPARASFADVAPICKTLWDQGYPYNNDCPTDDKGNICYTGCVATAMAQVMKTYNWPVKGIGENSYYCANLQKSVSFNFGETTFDWANMINMYPGNATQNAAVAQLMSAAGVSVDMGYGTNASGAFSQNVPGALIKYFNYDISAHLSYRRFYSLPTWMDMIYEELSNGYPIYYSGQAADGSGGHAFVIDGYRASDGYVHVNWGWSGMSDGYYQITTLDPAVQGAGGAGAGFSDSQGAIFSLRKPTEGSVVYPNLTVSGNFSTKSAGYMKGQHDFVTFMGTISSTALDKITYTLGVRLVPADGGNSQYLWRSGATTTETSGTVGSFTIAYSAFPTSGKYTVSPVFKYNGEIYDMPVAIGNVRSLTLEASASSLNFTPITEVAHLTADNIEVLTPVYAGKNARFSAVVKNTGDEYFGKINLAFTGAGATTQIYSTIAGPTIDLTEGESETVDFYGSVPTEILTPNTYLVIATEDGQFISDKVKIVLNPAPAKPAEVKFISQKVLNTFSGRGTSARPYVVTANPLTIEAEFECTAGEFFSDYVIYFLGDASSSSAMGYPSPDLTILQGETQRFTLNITDYSLVEGGKYKGVFGYIYTTDDGQRYFAPYDGCNYTYFRVSAAAGVSDVTTEAENVGLYPNPAVDNVTVSADASIESVEVYSVSGSLVLSAQFSGNETDEDINVSDLTPGIYVVKVNTAAGAVTERLIKK